MACHTFVIRGDAIEVHIIIIMNMLLKVKAPSSAPNCSPYGRVLLVQLLRIQEEVRQTLRVTRLVSDSAHTPAER